MRFAALPRSTVVAALLAFAATLHANVSLPRVFGDHMVLQRDLPVTVWGHADPGERVIVRFGGQERSATADDEGKWHAMLPPLPASAEPRDLTVNGNNTVTLHDVLVGEVWLCSGQSNMEMAVGVLSAGAQPETTHDPALAEQLKTATYPQIRLFRVEKKRQSPDVVSAGWTSCSGDALARFSAVAFFFGRELQASLGVPVGLIESAWGGSRIEEWISDAAYAPLQRRLGAEAERCFETNASLVSRNYDAMIAPLAPFSLRGVLWYQGESNIIAYNDGVHYADKFEVLVDSWRQAWHAPTLPFYAVQLAPYVYSQRKDKLPHGPDELPKLWEAQQLATAIPHTGLVPITDTVDNVHNIHPGKKDIVGHRLAELALADTYGRKGLVTAGPVFERADFRDGVAVIHFVHTAGGLVASDGKPLTNFEVAAADGKFVPARATMAGDTVEVRATGVSAPTAVRFGWTETARPNLANRAGWPAYPFRTDGPAWRP